MPSILSHPAIPLALGLGRRLVPGPLLLAGVAASMLPDLDVIGFDLGVPYGSAFGHRGCSHSLLTAAVIALLGAWALRRWRLGWVGSIGFLFVAAASHGILDACTSGGLGVALFWPWSEARYFAPFRGIRVAPLGLARFLSARGATVLLSEIRWVWLPSLALAAALALIRTGLGRGQKARVTASGLP
jgi:inner membrane protein